MNIIHLQRVSRNTDSFVLCCWIWLSDGITHSLDSHSGSVVISLSLHVSLGSLYLHNERNRILSLLLLLDLFTFTGVGEVTFRK